MLKEGFGCERKVHPCRCIKIILNFKFKVQSSKLKLHTHAQAIFGPKAKLLCKSLSCLNNIHEWTFVNKWGKWYNVNFKNSKQCLESLFWFEVFHERKRKPFEWGMKFFNDWNGVRRNEIWGRGGRGHACHMNIFFANPMWRLQWKHLWVARGRSCWGKNVENVT